MIVMHIQRAVPPVLTTFKKTNQLALVCLNCCYGCWYGCTHMIRLGFKQFAKILAPTSPRGFSAIRMVSSDGANLEPAVALLALILEFTSFALSTAALSLPRPTLGLDSARVLHLLTDFFETFFPGSFFPSVEISPVCPIVEMIALITTLRACTSIKVFTGSIHQCGTESQQSKSNGAHLAVNLVLRHIKLR